MYRLLSSNKKAKNARDAISDYEWNYRNYIGFIDYSKKLYDRRDMFYKLKYDILASFKPSCIHYTARGKYYLYYDFCGIKAHKPILLTSEYPELDIEEIGNLHNNGMPNNELASTQFIKKVANLISSNKAIFSEDLANHLK